MKLIAILLLLALATTSAFAYDPSPLQDYCVAVNCTRDGLYINGKFCKNPKQVSSEDFVFTGLRSRGNTSNRLRSSFKPAFVREFPGVNTLGVSMGRNDIESRGLYPPHTHPRASEILFVFRGTLYVGFVSRDQYGDRLFTKILKPGDIFVFPIGLIHFLFNLGSDRVLAFSSFNSQNPGIVTIANALFGSQPLISVEILAKAFRLRKKAIEYLQSETWCYNDTVV